MNNERNSVKDFLVQTTASILQIDHSVINTDLPLTSYGFDSISAVNLCSEIHNELRIYIDHEVIWQHSTIDELTEFLLDTRKS